MTAYFDGTTLLKDEAAFEMPPEWVFKFELGLMTMRAGVFTDIGGFIHKGMGWKDFFKSKVG